MFEPPARIRPVALALIAHRGSILVFRGRDHVKNQEFHRPLGGGINFGETAVAAVRRELLEEAHVELAQVSLLGVLENLFTLNGHPGHEVVFIFSCRLAEDSLHGADFSGRCNDNGTPIEVEWVPLETFRQGLARLYPSGLLELVTAKLSRT
ncbi:MAG: NUDIX hydrolase [Candidatus Dormibacteria bacterium]